MLPSGTTGVWMNWDGTQIFHYTRATTAGGWQVLPFRHVKEEYRVDFIQTFDMNGCICFKGINDLVHGNRIKLSVGSE